MANISEDTLLHIVNAKLSDAEDYNSEINQANDDLERRYQRKPYGTEVPGRSRFVTNDVKDAVQEKHEDLVRVFLGANEIIKFNPTDPEDPAQVQEADDKTKIVDWLIRGQTNSYKTQNSFLKDLLKFKAGFLKYYYQETESTEDHEWQNISALEVQEQLDAIVANKNNKELKLISSEIVDVDGESMSRKYGNSEAKLVEQEENQDGSFNIKIRCKVTRKEIKVIGVPRGAMRITKEATDLDEAELVGDVFYRTRGELMADGYSRKLVSSLPSATINGYSTRQINYDEQGYVQPSDYGEWASQSVAIQDLYVLVDYNGDGIPERRNIQKCNDIILENNPFNHVPYVAASAVIEPHRVIGESWAEQVTDIAEVNTAITRGILDNIYAVNNTKKFVRVGESGVNLDEAVSTALGGVIQVRGTHPLSEMIQPEIKEFIGDKSLLIKQHMDQMKALRVGSQMTSQGLDGDTLSKETATRFTGVEKSNQAKGELIARNVVEVGYRKLYEGVAWLLSHHQVDEIEAFVLGRNIKANPSLWKYGNNLSTEVGLGAGDDEKIQENMSALLNVLLMLKANGSKIVDEEKIYNVIKKLIRSVGIKNVGLYANNPEEAAETLMADNEQLNAMVLQLQEQLQQMQNPLAEAEGIKAQAKLIEAQGKGQIDAAKMMQEQQQFMAKMQQESDEFRQTLAKQLTELELKYQQDVPGSVV